jgi:hypothetical protein
VFGYWFFDYLEGGISAQKLAPDYCYISLGSARRLEDSSTEGFANQYKYYTTSRKWYQH